MDNNKTDLEAYKEKVCEVLLREIGKERTDTLMEAYEEDFELFMQKDWNPETAATAMIMGY